MEKIINNFGLKDGRNVQVVIVKRDYNVAVFVRTELYNNNNEVIYNYECGSYYLTSWDDSHKRLLDWDFLISLYFGEVSDDNIWWENP